MLLHGLFRMSDYLSINDELLYLVRIMMSVQAIIGTRYDAVRKPSDPYVRGIISLQFICE